MNTHEHSPPPGTPQTATKGKMATTVGAVSFMISSLVMRWLTGVDPQIAQDPMWIEAINIVVSGAVGGIAAGAAAYLVPNKPKRRGPIACHPLTVALAAALLLAGCGTKYVDLEGRSARNSLTQIQLDETAPYPAARWAQERFEQKLKRRALTDPVLAARWALDRKNYKRDLELAGHEVEVQAAALLYGADPESYRLQEARGMRRHERYYFADWTVAEIVAGMERLSAKALEWVQDHRGEIEKVKRRTD